MVKLIETITQIQSEKVLVIGDFMLDSYTLGKSSRISPEAPVPIVHVKEERSLPGGAGNVALNLISLGMQVSVLGRQGQDKAGGQLKALLEDEAINVSGLFVDPTYMTPIKNRVIVDNQQMIRLDHEVITPLTKELEEIIVAVLPQLLKDVKVVAISDYGKGFLSRSLLEKIISKACEFNIPVVVDPKGADFSKYKGATLVKPNLKEAYLASKLSSEATLEEVAETLLKSASVDYLMITRSEAGISLFNISSRKDFPVKVKEVKDVTGAGDTVLATITCALASSLSFEKGAELSNVAASLAIEHVGCARVTLADIASRLLSEHGHHKVVDHSNAAALHFALKNRPHTILELSDESILNPELFEKIQSLKATSDHTLVMKVPIQPKSPHLIPMLTSLREVDFVTLYE